MSNIEAQISVASEQIKNLNWLSGDREAIKEQVKNIAFFLPTKIAENYVDNVFENIKQTKERLFGDPDNFRSALDTPARSQVEQIISSKIEEEDNDSVKAQPGESLAATEPDDTNYQDQDIEMVDIATSKDEKDLIPLVTPDQQVLANVLSTNATTQDVVDNILVKNT